MEPAALCYTRIVGRALLHMRARRLTFGNGAQNYPGDVPCQQGTTCIASPGRECRLGQHSDQAPSSCIGGLSGNAPHSAASQRNHPTQHYNGVELYEPGEDSWK